jgi:H+/gluconate symporter-like permease
MIIDLIAFLGVGLVAGWITGVIMRGIAGSATMAAAGAITFLFLLNKL